MQTPMSLSTYNSLIQEKGLITVKFIARGMLRQNSKERFSRQLPGNNSQWGNCHFTFDNDAKEYDGLVMYHDLAREPMSLCTEKLSCSREKTILVTTDPPQSQFTALIICANMA
jgi:hypothetical protein